MGSPGLSVSCGLNLCQSAEFVTHSVVAEHIGLDMKNDCLMRLV